MCTNTLRGRLGAIVVALFVALTVTACGGGTSSQPGSPEPPTSQETPSSTPTAQDRLMELLGVSDSTCREIQNPSSWFDGATASVSCPVDGASRVHYHLFDTAADLRDAYAASLAEFESPPAGLSCADTPFAGRWYSDGETMGKVQCYLTNHDRAVIEWTVSGMRLYGVLLGADSDVAALTDVWQQINEGGVIEARDLTEDTPSEPPADTVPEDTPDAPEHTPGDIDGDGIPDYGGHNNYEPNWVPDLG